MYWLQGVPDLIGFLYEKKTFLSTWNPHQATTIFHLWHLLKIQGCKIHWCVPYLLIMLIRCRIKNIKSSWKSCSCNMYSCVINVGKKVDFSHINSPIHGFTSKSEYIKNYIKERISLKFMFSKKVTKICRNLHFLIDVTFQVQKKVDKFFHIFDAFS